jgi:hypothetical protein
MAMEDKTGSCESNKLVIIYTTFCFIAGLGFFLSGFYTGV